MTALREITAYFQNVQKREKIPFKNSEMADAIGYAASIGDRSSVAEFYTAIADAYVRANPDKPEDEMKRNARDVCAALAYFYDKQPTPFNFGPSKAYADKKQHGPAMRMVFELYQDDGIDMVKELLEAERRAFN